MRRPALVMLVCASLLAGCGDDDKKAKGRTVAVAAEKGVRIVGREYSFDPANVVVKGSVGDLKITLDNRGSLAHNVKIQEVEGAESDLGGSPTFPGGETRSGFARLDPGSYRMVCTVGNHEQLGMTGTLEVRQ